MRPSHLETPPAGPPFDCGIGDPFGSDATATAVSPWELGLLPVVTESSEVPGGVVG